VVLRPGSKIRTTTVSSRRGEVHPASIAKLLDYVGAQVVTDQIRVPVGGGQQPLHPIRGGLPGVLGQLPAVLARYRTQQAAQVGQHPPARLRTSEPTRDPGMQRLQPRRPGPHFLNVCCLVGLQHSSSRPTLALRTAGTSPAGGRAPTPAQVRLEYQ